jgi:lipopolysaccharide transport system ATP-binding protein
VLFVSHNMGAVSALCPRAVLLDGGRVIFDGSTAEAFECYLGRSSSNKDDSLGNDHGRISLLGRDRRFIPTSARLTSVVLLDASKAPTKVFNFGDPLRLRLGFEVLVPSSQPVSVEIYLKSRLGESITFFPSSQFQNVSVSGTARGEQIMDLTIPSLPLARGSYAFDLSLAIPQMQLLDYVESACDFQVEVSDPGKTGFSFEQRFGVGSVCIEHYWEPRPAQPIIALESELNVQ